ncbi:MAG: Ig-like domain-containing protein [Anaerolineaceae bacterium]|nr:Ig-like domain-containing protein [Anaerolineaceae bacterium]
MRKFLPLLLLMITAGLAYLAYTRLAGVRVSTFSPANDAEVSPRTSIRLEFDRPMDAANVEAAFSLSPAVVGRWQWNGQEATFTPEKAFEPGVDYQASLRSGARSLQGNQTLRAVSWSFQVRRPWVVYLHPLYGQRQLWRIPAAGGKAEQITRNGGGILDFAVSTDGEAIVYSVQKSGGGADLWEISREGVGARRLVDCGDAVCRNPVWSPDASTIAYSQSDLPVTAAGSAGQIWLADARTGKTAPIDKTIPIIGSELNWSPDSARLAFYDAGLHAIRVLSLNRDPEVHLQTTQEGVGVWLPGGQRIAYLDERLSGLTSYRAVVIYDFKSKSAETLLGQAGDTDFGLPDWSPDGNWLVVGQRKPGGNPSRRLWLVQADGKPVQPIADDPTSNAAFAHWDPWGRSVVFLRVKTGVAAATSEVVIWERASNGLRVLVEDGALPQWLP